MKMLGKISDKQREIAAMIGEFYRRKNNGDFLACQKELESLRITDIELGYDDAIVIHTSRPGVLIGKRGTNIDALIKFLGVEVRIVESDNWLDYLVPYAEEDVL